MPIGYLVTTLLAAVAPLLALFPRPTRGPRATPAFVLESNANELPFPVFYWLVASTVLAISEHDVASPVGWLAFGVALIATVGLGIVVARAFAARDTLSRALEKLDPEMARGLRWRLPLGRILIAPLPFRSHTVEHTRDIAYGPAGAYNSLDVYRHRSHPEQCPVLVYFHPGGFFTGAKSKESRLLFERFVDNGWVCISANYRLGDAGEFPNHLIDAKRVLAWIREHAQEYGVDTNTLLVEGGSAGAHLAMMCAFTANDPAFQPGFEAANTAVTAAIGFYGWYGPAPASGTSSSPAEYAHADAPPILVIHGDRDPMIAPANARQFVEHVSNRSMNPVAYAELPGGQHNFDRFASIRFAAVVDAVDAFARWVIERR